MRALSIPLLLLVTQGFAQTPQADFPADAAPLAANALQDRLSGKVYSLKPASGNQWRGDSNLAEPFSLTLAALVIPASGGWRTANYALKVGK